MAFIAIVLGIAAPRFNKALESARLRSDAQQMASLLKLARQEAITTSQARTIIFYPNNAKYKINGQSFFSLKEGISFVGTTTFIMQVGGLPACGFSAAGIPSSGGTITLQNSTDRIYIIVNPVAGRIRISDSPPTE